jgi:acetylornithine/N-succinyldiaminopimelate aminotransferase
MGDLLMARLAELESPHIVEVRGRGLMIGIELDIEVVQLLWAGYGQGVLLLNAGSNVLRLLPPYIITETEIDRLMDVLGAILPA